MEDLNNFAARAHFSVIKRNSSNKVKGFNYTNVGFTYQKGNIRASKAHSQSTFMSKSGCEWKKKEKGIADMTEDGGAAGQSRSPYQLYLWVLPIYSVPRLRTRSYSSTSPTPTPNPLSF